MIETVALPAYLGRVKSAFAVFAAGALVALTDLVGSLLPNRLPVGFGLIVFVVFGIEIVTLLGITLAGREEGIRYRLTDLPVPGRVALFVIVAAMAVLVPLGNERTEDALWPIGMLVLSGLGAWRALVLRNHRRALADPPF